MKDIISNPIICKINFDCDSVWKGKLCSCEAIQMRYLKDSLRIIKDAKLNAYVEPLAIDWITVWIYKYDYMCEVIKNLPDNPTTVFEHWILGKAFGYSDEAIKDFISPYLTKK